MLRLLINLDRATDRLAAMTERLDQYGVDWERVSACDCNDFDDGFVEDVYAKSSRLRQDAGSIGCFLTHRKCWKRLVESNHEYALIMEDDLLFGEGAGAFLTNADWLPKTHERALVHLETFGRVTVFENKAITSIGAYSAHHQRRLHHGSAAYIIHRDIAEKALAASGDYNQVPDEFLFMPPPHNTFHEEAVLQIVPAPMVQEEIFERLSGRTAQHKSMIAATRRGNRKGLTRLRTKLAHSFGKRWTIFMGRLADRRRGTTTTVVGFQ